MGAQILTGIYAARAFFLVLALTVIQFFCEISGKRTRRPRVQKHATRGFQTARMLEI